MKFKDVIEMIEKIAPPEAAEPWDNSGTQYRAGDDVEKILVCLELTKDVIEEAADGGCDMIVTHHPLIFDPLMTIDPSSEDAELAKTSWLLAAVISRGISVYSAHTSFDSAPEGNNVYLAKLLGGRNIEGPDEEREGTVFTLDRPLSVDEFIEKIRRALCLKEGYIRAVADSGKMVSKAAVCTGAGAVFMSKAIEEGCDALVTGDVRFNQAQTAYHHGFCLIDAGHYGTEKIFAENFKEQLAALAAEEGADLVIETSGACGDPYYV